MKQVVFMAGKPIQHVGENGRELPFKEFNDFIDLEVEHIWIAAAKVEGILDNLNRCASFNEAYKELFDICKDVPCNNKIILNRIVRRFRSYILEVDIFIKHWEKYFSIIDKNKTGAIDYFKKVTSEAFDSSIAYAMICILRNYQVHANDVVHDMHIGLDGLRIWANRDILLSDMHFTGKKKEILQKQDIKIDLLKLIKESLPVINNVHEKLIDYLIDNDIKSEIKYLVTAADKTVMINPTDWYIFNYKGSELVKVPSWIGIMPGIGMDYLQLRWAAYRELNRYIDDKRL
jgi:hypothetical protein